MIPEARLKYNVDVFIIPSLAIYNAEVVQYTEHNPLAIASPKFATAHVKEGYRRPRLHMQIPTVQQIS